MAFGGKEFGSPWLHLLGYISKFYLKFINSNINLIFNVILKSLLWKKIKFSLINYAWNNNFYCLPLINLNPNIEINELESVRIIKRIIALYIWGKFNPCIKLAYIDPDITRKNGIK